MGFGGAVEFWSDFFPGDGKGRSGVTSAEFTNLYFSPLLVVVSKS